MKVFIFDLDRCNGCHNCQIACKDEHCDNDWSPIAKPQPDTGQFWNKVEQKVRGQVPKVRVSYVLHMCQHCDDCELIKRAPEAVYKREDGLVIIDPEKAVGHKELVDACPYGAVYYNAALDIPQKCTGCAHLLDDGWEMPRCVEACGLRALRFGEEADFAVELAASEELVPKAETRPRMHYLNLPKRFIAGTVVDLSINEVLIGATVTLENKETGALLATKTDEFGDFWFKQIAPGSYNVYFEAAGYLTRKIETDTLETDMSVGAVELFKDPLA